MTYVRDRKRHRGCRETVLVGKCKSENVHVKRLSSVNELCSLNVYNNVAVLWGHVLLFSGGVLLMCVVRTQVRVLFLRLCTPGALFTWTSRIKLGINMSFVRHVTPNTLV